MKKVYRLSGKVSQEQAEEILRELQEQELVQSAEFLEENAYLEIGADEENFSGAMDRVVNICRRIANGCDMSYAWYHRA